MKVAGGRGLKQLISFRFIAEKSQGQHTGTCSAVHRRQGREQVRRGREQVSEHSGKDDCCGREQVN